MVAEELAFEEFLKLKQEHVDVEEAREKETTGE